MGNYVYGRIGEKEMRKDIRIRHRKFKMNIIYIRTSTEEQNPQNQIKDCEKVLNEEYALFEDKQSAYKDNKERESFEKVRKLIKSGKVNHFIVWDLDRIYRNRIKLKQFFEFCKMYKCNIHSFNQDWLEQLNKIPAPFNEIMHDLMLNLMGWLGEDESKKKKAEPEKKTPKDTPAKAEETVENKPEEGAQKLEEGKSAADEPDNEAPAEVQESEEKPQEETPEENQKSEDIKQEEKNLEGTESETTPS